MGHLGESPVESIGTCCRDSASPCDDFSCIGERASEVKSVGTNLPFDHVGSAVKVRLRYMITLLVSGNGREVSMHLARD